jgi:hypothetical protein
MSPTSSRKISKPATAQAFFIPAPQQCQCQPTAPTAGQDTVTCTFTPEFTANTMRPTAGKQWVSSNASASVIVAGDNSKPCPQGLTEGLKFF